MTLRERAQLNHQLRDIDYHMRTLLADINTGFVSQQTTIKTVYSAIKGLEELKAMILEILYP